METLTMNMSESGELRATCAGGATANAIAVALVRHHRVETSSKHKTGAIVTQHGHGGVRYETGGNDDAAVEETVRRLERLCISIHRVITHVK